MNERLMNRIEENLRDMEALADEVEATLTRCGEETAELQEGLDEKVENDRD